MPAKCGCVPLIHRPWPGSEARVKSIILRYEAAVTGLSSEIPARLGLFWLFLFCFKLFNVVKKIQILES